GIRDGHVTGVQTCALPICLGRANFHFLLQREMEIGPAEAAPELAARMSEAGAPLVEETLRGLDAGTIVPRPQNHAEATIAPILKIGRATCRERVQFAGGKG